MKGTG